MIDGGKTVSAIAEKFSISRTRVHQINQSKVFWDKKQKLYNAIKTSHYFFPEKTLEELADHFHMPVGAIDKILEDYYNDKD
jgi:DNA-directed RNA polymerase sigma subunit (sigma70/sigma32)